MSDVIISVEGLGKKYVLSHQGGGERGGYARFSERLEGWIKKPFAALAAVGSRISDIGDGKAGASQYPISNIPSSSTTEEFWALKDVSFEVKRGEVVGIIGRNGAGKSTLLKILSRITEPTEGRVTLRGRVASLLEVGTGFHPELTGRENIFLNGAILGMTKAEIRKKFDEIVAFAEVERFLDTPVKRYSSGMYVRLAFAVAAHLEPEILVVDEVLAVGDAEFQKKCLGKMKDVATGGRTVLFVSHNMGAVQTLCSRAVWLETGRLKDIGAASHILKNYAASSIYHNCLKIGGPLAEKVQDVSVQVMTDDEVVTSAVDRGKPILIRGSLTLRKEINDAQAFLGIISNGNRLFTLPGFANRRRLPEGQIEILFKIPAGVLRPGSYELGFGISEKNKDQWAWTDQAFVFEVLEQWKNTEDRFLDGFIDCHNQAL